MTPTLRLTQARPASSNPALAALPSRILARPLDRDSVALAMHSLCDVLWTMPPEPKACGDKCALCLASDYVRPDDLVDKSTADLARDWIDDASGPAQGVLDGTVTADDLARGVRILHRWLSVTA